MAATLALALACSAATAAEDPPDCDNPTTQLAMNFCAGQDYLHADARRKALYGDLIRRLDAKSRAAAQDARQAWLQYRKLQCDYAALRYQGGAMERMVRSSCLERLTRQRNAILESMLEQASL